MGATKRNDWETLHDVYPELKQQPYNNKGYDYLLTNIFDIQVRIEHKYRGGYGSKAVKYDITQSQYENADVFALTDAYGNNYFMLGDKYRRLAKIHSYAATAKRKGVQSKSHELSHKLFVENATTDLYEVVNKVKHKFGNLGEFV